MKTLNEVYYENKEILDSIIKSAAIKSKESMSTEKFNECFHILTEKQEHLYKK